MEIVSEASANTREPAVPLGTIQFSAGPRDYRHMRVTVSAFDCFLMNFFGAIWTLFHLFLLSLGYWGWAKEGKYVKEVLEVRFACDASFILPKYSRVCFSLLPCSSRGLQFSHETS